MKDKSTQIVTDWPPGMLQDDCRALSRALANTPHARLNATEAAAEKRITMTTEALKQAALDHLAEERAAAFSLPLGDGRTVYVGTMEDVAGMISDDAQPVARGREALIDLIAEHLAGTYHCNRVWGAWAVGTMHQSDFSRVDESDTPSDIADAVMSVLTEPLTEAQITAATLPLGYEQLSPIAVARAIEAAHGIK